MAFVEGAVVVLLLMLNGFLAMSEIAIVSSRRGRLDQLADAGRADARTALALAADPSRYLAAIQMGMTLIGILAGTSWRHISRPARRLVWSLSLDRAVCQARGGRHRRRGGHLSVAYHRRARAETDRS